MKELFDIDLIELIEIETGNRFNREGYINCPFHKDKTPSMSVKFFPNINKQRYKCWGCDATGDALDFIRQYKGVNLKQAREYLGIEVKSSVKESQIEKIKSYIDWQIKTFKIGFKLLGIFPFTDKNGDYIYFKAKLLKPDGKKETPYYFIDGDKVENKRGHDEVPYNLYELIKAIEEDKTIVICEGEKDCNTINSFKIDNYVATSLKGVHDLSLLEGCKIYVCGDTGAAGYNYKKEIYDKLFEKSQVFKFINLPGITKMGDNKDVTDWLEAGRKKDDLLVAFSRSLDLKSTFELQQDFDGVYKNIPDKKDPNIFTKRYLTDFKVLEAKRLMFTEDGTEGIKLKLKSSTGAIVEKLGKSTVFDDVKSFKNFLGTLDLSFTGRDSGELTDLKKWINKYFSLENEERYLGVKFIDKNNIINIVTGEGALNKYGVDYSMVADNSEIDILDKDRISKEELKELKQRIFRFIAADKSISIIGTVINDMAVFQNEKSKNKLHHLLIVGESGCGKTTILENVIAPILNYPLSHKKSIGMISNAAMIRDLSTGNYPSLYDEFKPSMLDRYKKDKLSETFRNAYDRATVARGNKSFESNKEYRYTRPLIMAGEESYPNQEKAAIERSCIVYISKRERTKENTESMMWLIKNEDILNKFGRSIIEEILNISVEEYKEIREKLEPKFANLPDRAATTAINIATGIEIFNILLQKNELKSIENYESHIYSNIKEEILDGGEDTKSVVEQMLTLYNSMIEDGRAYDSDNVVRLRGDGLFIRTSEMINQIHQFVNQVGSSEVIPLKLTDFKKQSKKAGYLVKSSSKPIKIETKTIRFDEYSVERIRELKLFAIVDPELTPVQTSADESKVIDGMFKEAK